MDNAVGCRLCEFYVLVKVPRGASHLCRRFPPVFIRLDEHGHTVFEYPDVTDCPSCAEYRERQAV
jgi:hypothetical protein